MVLAPVVRLRVAASATAGMSGSTYCGSFDWLSVKKSSGAINQQASSNGSLVAGSRRPAHVTRQCRRRASAGMIQGNAATGTIGR